MRVLVAEDDRISLRMLEGLLSNWGYEVVAASNGGQALQILQQEDAPRLAILDWSMPVLTGVEVCARIRQVRTPTPPHIILLTARTNNLDLVAGLTAGASDYIRKPFDASELGARVNVGRTVVELQARVACSSCRFESRRDLLVECEPRRDAPAEAQPESLGSREVLRTSSGELAKS